MIRRASSLPAWNNADRIPLYLIRRRRLQLSQPALAQELLFDQFVAAFTLRHAAG
jgi:hypothetical protein